MEIEAPQYVRSGRGYTIRAAKDLGQGIEALAITYTVAGKSTTEVVPFQDESLRIVRAAPASGTLGLRFEWAENPGEQDACRGSDTYARIPVIGANLKAGRPGVTRFVGQYRASFRDARGSSTWTMRPNCDVFGCGTRLRSSGGLRGTFFPQDDGTYRLTRRFTAGYCRVTYSSGRRVTWTIFGYRRISLRVTASRDGVATRFSGRETTSYDVPSDPGGACAPPGTERTRVTVVRR